MNVPRVQIDIGLYILDPDGAPRHVFDTLEWGRWFEGHSRQIACDVEGEARVSTVFLGLDHRFFSDGPPILWETMIFGGRHDGWQERYASRADAEAGHARAVTLVRETL